MITHSSDRAGEKKVVYFNSLNSQHAHNYMCWTTYTRQYRISVRRLMSLHMFVVNVIVAFFLIIFFIFLLALCRVVPDPEAILLCQGPGMSMRTMCMRIWIRVRTGTHTNIYMCICIYLQDF